MLIKWDLWQQKAYVAQLCDHTTIKKLKWFKLNDPNPCWLQNGMKRESNPQQLFCRQINFHRNLFSRKCERGKKQLRSDCLQMMPKRPSLELSLSRRVKELAVICHHDWLSGLIEKGNWLIPCGELCLITLPEIPPTPPTCNKHQFMFKPVKARKVKAELYCYFRSMCKLFSYNMRWHSQIELSRVGRNKSASLW